MRVKEKRGKKGYNTMTYFGLVKTSSSIFQTVANRLDKFTNEMSAVNLDNLEALKLEFHELLQHEDKLQVFATQNHPSTKELGKLSPLQETILQKEIDEFSKHVDFDLEALLETNDFAQHMADLPQFIEDKCPFLQSIIKTLFTVKKNVQRQTDETIRLRSIQTAHAVAMLLNIRNQKIDNSFKLAFTILLITLGAGGAMLTDTNNMGLTLSYIATNRKLDSIITKTKITLEKELLKGYPIIYLLDNINIHRGQHKH